MKSYSSLEKLAEDQKISVRTAWRWLRAGRIEREKKNGQIFYILVSDTDSDSVSDNKTDVTGDTDVSDRIETRYSPIKKVLPVSDPSYDLKSERENTEKLLLKIEQKKALKTLQKMNDEEPKVLKERRAEVEAKALSLEEIKIEREMERLTFEQKQKESETRKRDLIESVKTQCVPKVLKKYLPIDLYFLTLTEIDKELRGMDLNNLSPEECVSYGFIVRNRIWHAPENFSIVFRALMMSLLGSIEESIKTLWNSYQKTTKQKINYDDFYRSIISEWFLNNPREFSEALIFMRDLVFLFGNDSQKARIVWTLSKFLNDLGRIEMRLNKTKLNMSR